MDHIVIQDMGSHFKCEKCWKTFLEIQDETFKQVRTDNINKIESAPIYTFSKRAQSPAQYLFLILYCLLTTVSGGSYNSPQACLGDQQRNIFNSMPKCQSRPTLIDLREKLSNHSEVIKVVPDHVSVERCGGSCYVPSHSCNPTMRSTNMVQVMLVLSKWPHGEHETVCTEVEVDVHDECECGCKVQSDQCLPDLQYFHQPSCGCICTNSAERSACILNNKVWDPATCQCHCPAHSWQHCSTGYMFDYVFSCSCVQISSVASKSVHTVLILLSASISVSLVGGYLMFKFKRGPFKEENKDPSSFKRTHLMSQISKNEFDLMNLKAELGTENLLTVKEFDDKRSPLSCYRRKWESMLAKNSNTSQNLDGESPVSKIV